MIGVILSKDPCVSVCIANYNYAHTLGIALHSVIRQSMSDFEILVIDDGSTDDSIALLQEWAAHFPEKIRILRHENNQNRGVAATYQLAFHSARGEFVAFLEADDAWHPRHLERKIHLLKSKPDIGVIFSMYEPFGEPRGKFYWRLYQYSNRISIPKQKGFNALKDLLMRNPVASFSNFIVRKPLIQHIKPCHPKELYFDWWCLAHLAMHTDFYYLQEKLTMWRIHINSANYTRFTLKELKGSQEFLLRLYSSLLMNRPQPAQINMIKTREKRMFIYQSLSSKLQPLKILYELLLKEPVQSLRFLLHIGLKNILFQRTREADHV